MIMIELGHSKRSTTRMNGAHPSLRVVKEVRCVIQVGSHVVLSAADSTITDF